MQTPWDWAPSVRSGIPTNLSNLVGTLNRRLTVGGRAVSVSAFDRAAMVLGEHAASGPSFVLIPPDPYVPTCTYIELAAHVARMSANDDYRTDLRVAVVSANTSLRTFHRKVRLGQQPHLETIVPTEVVSHGNVLRYGDSESTGATVFVERVSDLDGVEDIDFAVVDAPCYGMASVLEFARYAVFVVRDPSDPSLAELAATMPTFGWAQEDISRLRDPMLQRGPHFEHLAARLKMFATGCERSRVVPVPSDTVARLAAEAWQILPEVIRAVPSTSAGRDLLKIAFGRYFVLLHQVVPTSFFARYYGDGLLGSLESAARMIRGDGGNFYIPYFVETLQQLAAAIGSFPPKAEEFVRTVKPLVDEYGKAEVRIAAPNVTMATMIRDYLGSNEDVPEVVPFSALTRVRPTLHLVLTGMPPAWARNVLTSGVARAVHVIAYAADDTGIVAEASVCGRLADCAFEYRQWMGRTEARQICWGRLSAEPAEVMDPTPRPPKVEVADIDMPVIETSITSLWDGLLESGALSRSDPIGQGGGASVTAGASEANIISFTDGRWLLLSPDSWVSRLKANRGEEGVQAADLRIANTLVVADHDPRKMLLDKVIEQAGAVPEYALLAEFVRQWRIVLRRGYAQEGTYGALHALLAKHDVNVGDQAVAMWVRGTTIGPSDRENVRRVGEALGDNMLVEHYRMVCDAITTLRGIHVKLGKRVGDLAVHAGVAGAIGARGVDEIVDDVSGLTIGDFRGCVELLTIADIQTLGMVPSQMLGTLRASNERFEGDRS